MNFKDGANFFSSFINIKVLEKVLREQNIGMVHYLTNKKKDFCKKRREAYAQKKALAKEAITNYQCKFIYVKQYTFHLI